jgi:GT2 family glycosyltransferase
MKLNSMDSKNIPKVSIIIPTIDRFKKLDNCLGSIYDSDYKDYDVTIIDNGSKTDLQLFVTKEEYSPLKILRNSTNIGLASARNQGCINTIGQYLLFIDDDNVVDPKMIGYMVSCLENNNKLGIVAPKTMYKSDPNRIWFYGAGLNLLTSRAVFPHFDVIDENDEINHNAFISSVHNCFMIRRDVFEGVGMFDEKMFVTHTEFDFCMKAQSICTIMLCGKAKCYHDRPREPNKRTLRHFGFTNKYRVYYLSRNRAVIIKRYSNFLQKIIFLTLLYPMFTIYYSVILLSFGRRDYLKNHIRGTLAGIYYFLHAEYLQFKEK